MTQMTTMKVRTTDRILFGKLFGAPTHIAFHKLLRDHCPHPEGKRAYTTAIVSIVQGEAINAEGKTAMVAGFRCHDCGSYVFPDASHVKA